MLRNSHASPVLISSLSLLPPQKDQFIDRLLEAGCAFKPQLAAGEVAHYSLPPDNVASACIKHLAYLFPHQINDSDLLPNSNVGLP